MKVSIRLDLTSMPSRTTITSPHSPPVTEEIRGHLSLAGMNASEAARAITIGCDQYRQCKARSELGRHCAGKPFGTSKAVFATGWAARIRKTKVSSGITVTARAWTTPV